MRLGEMTIDDLEQIKGSNSFLVPFGAIESHGSHLPLATDTLIVNAIVDRIMPSLPKSCLLFPVATMNPTNPVRCRGWESIGNPRIDPALWQDFTIQVLKCFADNLSPQKILLLTWHDTLDFIACLRRVCFCLSDIYGIEPEILRLWEIARAWAFSEKLVGEEERHAALIETSILLVTNPELVKGRDFPDGKWVKKPGFGVDWNSYSQNGVYGNASKASAEIGIQILEHLTHTGSRHIRTFLSEKPHR